MKNTTIKLQNLFAVLSIMAILSTIIGGYLYYSALTKFSIDRAHKITSDQLQIIGNDIDSYLTWSLLSIKSLAGLKEIKQSFLGEQVKAIDEINTILDRFRDDFKVDVCYLMNSSGNTIASSNRDATNSFVGKNYGFRPYFKQAMKGEPTVYMALGVTSKKRGIYYSHPVFSEGKQTPIGVAVIKASVEQIEKKFITPDLGIVLLIDPHGVVFLSNHTEWLYQILWEPSSKLTSDIAKTKQFGRGPWNWTGMKLLDEDHAVDGLDNKYRAHQQELVKYPGWSLVSLNDYNELKKRISIPLKKSVGVGIITLCAVFGFTVFFLFIKASASIIQRKKAEDALRKSEEKYHIIMETTHDATYICSHDFKIEYMNHAMIEQLGGDVTGEICYESLHGLEKKCPWCLHHRVQEGEYVDQMITSPRNNLSYHVSHAPIPNKDGSISKMAVFRDVTELKKSEDLLRESENKFRAFAEQSYGGVYLIQDGDFKYVNPKFVEMFGYSNEEYLKKNFFHKLVHPEDLSKVKEQVKKRETGKAKTVQYTFRGLTKSGEIIHVEIFGSSVMIEGKLSAIGTIVDISDRISAEQEKEKLIIDLQNALKDVKRLSGLLPICASCKKIRDDKGYWNQIEEYIDKHSEATFSHGICDKCAKKLYPDLNLYDD